jgi:hypothetical protein
MSSTSASNMAAVAAAVKEAGGTPFAVPMPPKKAMPGRGNGSSYKSLDQSPGVGPEGYPSPPSSLPTNSNGYSFSQKGDFPANHSSAIADGTASSDNSLLANKSRVRRASEGAHIIKGEGKRANGNELRCEKCGKGYKHSSCLTKHLFVLPAFQVPHTFTSKHLYSFYLSLVETPGQRVWPLPGWLLPWLLFYCQCTYG